MLTTPVLRETAPPAPVRRRRLRRPFDPWHLLLMPVALVFAFPLVQMILTSFMSAAEINSYPPRYLPRSPQISGYVGLFTNAPALRWLGNSVIVAGVAVLSHLVLCSAAGYGFARLRFAGRRIGFLAILATIMIPTQLLMIPTYVMFSRFGLVDTLAAAIVPWLSSAFGIFLMRQFFLSLPVELEDAARIDGCSTFGVFRRIVLPLARPALATLTIFTLLGSWNDLLWPLVAISDERWYTIQLGLANFQGPRRTDWPMLMSGNVVATLPLVIGFVLVQRRFIATMTMAGIK
ncbi:carbohydrate ABC transporter permease [Spongiactinospora rosea]|uniref:Carbohydrate ABC transporter permease n=1 Tax=Spongiactinospora rosea TaxID=2248750 RepID=A0A366LQQ7_9ACTN|nr:carbohydrate ABC transporter permease [Spongiactinospora rosea]RBQ15739.1 carbohydrate ABC transporter permease [Spongiactinospora rosea]